MKRLTQCAVVSFLVLVPLAGLSYAYPEWPTDAGLDVWNAPTLRAEIERQQRHENELDGQLRATARRLAVKHEVADEVIAGRLTLREAARAYREANSDNPRFIAIMRLRYEGSDDAMQAQNVIDTIAGLLDKEPRRDEILARLRSEFESLKRDGEVRLN